MSNNVQEFIEITGADPSTASQFLDMANGNIDTAISLFFDNSTPHKPAPPKAAPPAKPGPKRGSQPPPEKVDKPQGHIVDQILDHAGQTTGQEGPEHPENIEKHTIIFWKNGFQLDDGEYRLYDDPANKEFLDACNKGRIPRELYKPGICVDVEVENNRDTEYKPKPKPFQPFSGKAHTFTSNPKPAQPSQPAQSKAPSGQVKTDFSKPNQPSTKVRARLPDGQTITLTVSATDHVRDLIGYIKQVRSDLAGSKLQISQMMPPTPITDESLTIEAAGLKMASITVGVL